LSSSDKKPLFEGRHGNKKHELEACGVFEQNSKEHRE